MKIIHRSAAWFITALLLFTTLISCEEQETDLVRRDGLISSPLGFTEKSTATISNGFPKDKLIQHAYEAYATFYNVELTAENTKVIDEATLQAWVKANGKNKHKSINQKNQAALAEIANQGDIHALLVTAPAGAAFKKSVFVFSSIRSILISDVVDNLVGPGLKIVKTGVGFYGNGTLDPFGNIPCGCVEEYKIIFSNQSYTQCGRCPDLADL